MNDPFIHFHRPSIGEEEINEVVETLRSGWLTTGPRAARFERDFREYTGAPHAVAVNSATAGLHLALAGLGIGPGDEVITTPMTFCATVQAILHVGATPVLADIGWDGNIDPEEIAKRITGRTRAIIPVHMAGLPCDMTSIWALARRRGIHVIEDAAHAAGARYEGRPIGAGPMGTADASDAVAFSFYATKNLTTGEGGMITTHRPALAQTMRMLALHGVSHEAWDRYTDKRRLALRRAGPWIQVQPERHSGGARHPPTPQAGPVYRTARADTPGCTTTHSPVWKRWRLRPTIPAAVMRGTSTFSASICAGSRSTAGSLSANCSKEASARACTSSRFRCFAIFARLPLAQYACPRALELYPRIVSLPLYPAMTEEQVQYVARSVREVVESSRRVRLVATGAQTATLPAGALDAAGS